jgi:putative colanic acid biosynthesis UDP-glucose lipid carrier transferase
MLGRRMQVVHEGDVVVLSLCREPLSRWYNRALKRLLDLLLSLIFLLTLFPLVYVVMAVLTKWKSPGPVFRVHKRCGMDGREVRCLTFRHKAIQLVERMPLMLSVFGGNLSLVGPRPLHPLGREAWLRQVNRYVERYPVKPGLTGLAQQHGLGDETGDEARLQQRAGDDAWYMEHWSLWLDVRLLLSAPFRVSPDKKYLR